MGGHQTEPRNRIRRAGRVLAAATAILGLAGCGEPTPATMAAAAGPSPATVADRINSSELGLSMAIPRSLRVAARSPEDHELRLAGRTGESQSLVGRMTLITRESREAVLNEAMGAIDDTWNRALFDQQLTDDPSARPEVVRNFYPAGDNGLTIVKKRLQARKPLPTPRNNDLLQGEQNAVDILALAYFVQVQPTAAEGAEPPVAAAGAVRGRYMVALFVLENSSAAEATVDDMIKSIRLVQ